MFVCQGKVMAQELKVIYYRILFFSRQYESIRCFKLIHKHWITLHTLSHILHLLCHRVQIACWFAKFRTWLKISSDAENNISNETSKIPNDPMWAKNFIQGQWSRKMVFMYISRKPVFSHDLAFVSYCNFKFRK